MEPDADYGKDRAILGRDKGALKASTPQIIRLTLLSAETVAINLTAACGYNDGDPRALLDLHIIRLFRRNRSNAQLDSQLCKIFHRQVFHVHLKNSVIRRG